VLLGAEVKRGGSAAAAACRLPPALAPARCWEMEGHRGQHVLQGRVHITVQLPAVSPGHNVAATQPPLPAVQCSSRATDSAASCCIRNQCVHSSRGSGAASEHMGKPATATVTRQHGCIHATNPLQLLQSLMSMAASMPPTTCNCCSHSSAWLHPCTNHLQLLQSLMRQM
jgi:hypothetical protein